MDRKSSWWQGTAGMWAGAGAWAAASPPCWNPLDANPPGLVAPSAYFWCSVTHVLCDCDMPRAAKGAEHLPGPFMLERAQLGHLWICEQAVGLSAGTATPFQSLREKNLIKQQGRST